MNPTYQDYCQFLIITQKSYTQTYFTDHQPALSRPPTDHTDWVVANNLSQGLTDDTKKEFAVRWKIEQYHRENKP